VARREESPDDRGDCFVGYDGRRRVYRTPSRPSPSPPRAYAGIDDFVSRALAPLGDVAVSWGVPWCELTADSPDSVLVSGCIYDEELKARVFYVAFERTETAWAWTLGLDPVHDDYDTFDLSCEHHPCTYSAPAETVWRHRITGTCDTPVRPAAESETVWRTVFDVVVREGDALALCALVEGSHDLHANGCSLDMLRGLMTERKIADTVATWLNERDGGSREYYQYYRCTRARDATAEECAAFEARCAERGIQFSRSGDRPVGG
jgi:hypothetical protein